MSDKSSNVTVCIIVIWQPFYFIGATVSFFTSVHKIIHTHTNTTGAVMFYRITAVKNRNKGKVLKWPLLKGQVHDLIK